MTTKEGLTVAAIGQRQRWGKWWWTVVGAVKVTNSSSPSDARTGRETMQGMAGALGLSYKHMGMFTAAKVDAMETLGWNIIDRDFLIVTSVSYHPKE
ncbi:hypothetical protein DM860_009472 [Cuscuta australis]|uniref:Uncharacterized protein n=1 Tax=Cuscuta australis TaxID=267555 RepID=A0A328DLT2_9ASTE|nr:hypothetical protein DM860_009472 [Cuscuta australis]